MQLLFQSSEHVSDDHIAIIVYHSRPFRFVLPLTFLYDIFGGERATVIIEKKIPPAKCRGFAECLLLKDEKERAFVDDCYTDKLRNLFSEAVVKWRYLARAFLNGGLLAYILGLTNDFNEIDVYIEYDNEVFPWIKDMRGRFRPRPDQIILGICITRNSSHWNNRSGWIVGWFSTVQKLWADVG